MLLTAAEGVRRIAASARGLADVVDKIGSVAELICSIAAQSSPLVLNAMIEVGRRTAVVVPLPA